MFDLFEYRRKASNLVMPNELFNLWEEVCRYYDRGEISRQELDEMRALICPTLESLAVLKKLIDAIETNGVKAAASKSAS